LPILAFFVNVIGDVRAERALLMQSLPEHPLLKPYSQAESEAKKAKRGIWSLGVKYISPKDWRKRNK
jgi:endonuclease YncB( thermonuclease family)